MTKSYKTMSAAIAAVAGLMLIAAVTLPTTAFAAPKENPKTDTEERDFRTNPNNKPIPGEETETTVESCTVPSGNTPPGHSPEGGDCKGQATYECDSTTVKTNPGGQSKTVEEEC